MPTRTDEILAKIAKENPDAIADVNKALSQEQQQPKANPQSQEQSYKELTGKDLNQNAYVEKGVNYNPSSKVEQPAPAESAKAQDRNGMHERNQLDERSKNQLEEVKKDLNKSQEKDQEPER